MAKFHIANLIEINHWVVDDNDEFDQGRWEGQDRLAERKHYEAVFTTEERSTSFCRLSIKGPRAAARETTWKLL